MAAVAAPFIGALIAIPVYLAIVGLIGGESSLLAFIRVAFTIALYTGALLGVPAMVLFGLPIHSILLAFGYRSAWHYSLMGALAGMVVGAIVLLWLSDAPAETTNWAPSFALGSFTGALSALTFWLVRRPDRDAANPARPAP